MKVHYRTTRHLGSQAGDWTFMHNLGYTRGPTSHGEWDDPTWIRACVDPDLMDEADPDDRVTDQP